MSGASYDKKLAVLVQEACAKTRAKIPCKPLSHQSCAALGVVLLEKPRMMANKSPWAIQGHHHFGVVRALRFKRPILGVHGAQGKIRLDSRDSTCSDDNPLRKVVNAQLARAKSGVHVQVNDLSKYGEYS